MIARRVSPLAKAGVAMGVVAGILIASYWGWEDRGDSTGNGGAKTEEATLGEHGEGKPKDPTGEGDDQPAAESPYAAAESARQVVSVPALTGSVQTRDGAAIEGAVVSWTRVRAADLQADSNAEAFGRAADDSMTVWTRSDEDGAFEFATPPRGESDRASVLWASHVGHGAQSVWLEAPDEQARSAGILVLPGMGPLDVRVIDGDGNPVIGARLEHLAVDPPCATLAPDDPARSRRERMFLGRQAETNEQGRALLGAFPGEQLVSAKWGSFVSSTWRGEAPAEITLSMAPTFIVGGQILFPLGGAEEDSASAEAVHRIVLWKRTGNIWSELLAVPDVAEGPWGPLAIPRLPRSRYRVDLESTRFVPVSVEFDAPALGNHVAIDLAPPVPGELWFFAEKEDGEAVDGAVLHLEWTAGEREGRLQVAARPDGYVYMGNAPTGQIRYWFTAPEYADSEPGVLQIPLPEPTTLLVTMQRAGILRGRCLHGEQPVEDFEVMVWRSGLIGTGTPYPFRARAEGTFEIPGAPVGEVCITASSAELPSCEPLTVDVSEAAVSEVELRLSSPLVGRGRVVDERSGDPLPEATIQTFVAGATAAIAPWGLPFPVESDGSFAVPGFTARRNYFLVEAPGYSSHFGAVVAENGDAVELGRIALSRTQSLHVQLTTGGADPQATDFSTYTFRAEGPVDYPTRNFAPDGRLRIDDMSAGFYTLVVKRPGGVWHFVTTKLEPHAEWDIQLRVGGSRHLTVNVLDEHGQPADMGYLVEVLYRPDTSFLVRQRERMGPGGTTEFAGIDSDRIEVQLVSDDFAEVYAHTWASFEGQQSLTLDLALGGRSLVVRVVDEGGSAVSGARVRLADPEDPRLMFVGMTGPDGIASILGVPEKRLVGHLLHNTLGTCNGLEVDGARDEVELVFVTGGAVELVVVDGPEKLVDVRCAMWDPFGDLSDRRTTSEDGRVSYRPLAPGPYRFHAERIDCWPIDFDAEARTEDHVTTIEMRRLGGVEFTVFANDGTPAAGRPVTLHSLEFDTDVDEWRKAGRLPPEGSLTTDAAGRLLVEGLPHGSYRWQITAAGGDVAAGQVELLPAQMVKVNVPLP